MTPFFSRYKFSVKPQEALLILITMFWGGTFLAVQYAVTLSGPLFFVGLRFATAAIAVALLSLKVLRGITWLEIKACKPGDSKPSPAASPLLLRRCMYHWCRYCSGFASAGCRA